jgi:tagatose-1,6-bisphosphate aldolase
LGGDVLKTEFPVDVKAFPELGQWEAACRELTEASTIPWVLLSAGVDYPVFENEAEVACRAGASGILAGRAIWKEALEVPEHERLTFLEGIGRERMQNLDAICNRYARPYTELFASQSLTEDWYACYAGL